MINLARFYRTEGNQIVFERPLASAFAKEVADDFNPLHDPDAKLFCVPGDLLFAVALARYGLSPRMCFTFSGMVDGEEPITLPESDGAKLDMSNARGKTCLSLEREGPIQQDPELIRSLTCTYVRFSGHTFPDILIPLLAEHGVMLNPARPLVIYHSMKIHLHRLDLREPELDYTGATLEHNGKKGEISLNFLLREDGKEVGEGAKYMLVRGLRDYDKEVVDKVVADYNEIKRSYQPTARED